MARTTPDDQDIGHDQVVDTLEAFARRELPPDASARTWAHVTGCRDCRGRLAVLHGVAPAGGPVPPAERIVPGSSPSPFAPAAPPSPAPSHDLQPLPAEREAAPRPSDSLGPEEAWSTAPWTATAGAGPYPDTQAEPARPRARVVIPVVIAVVAMVAATTVWMRRGESAPDVERVVVATHGVSVRMQYELSVSWEPGPQSDPGAEARVETVTASGVRTVGEDLGHVTSRSDFGGGDDEIEIVTEGDFEWWRLDDPQRRGRRTIEWVRAPRRPPGSGTAYGWQAFRALDDPTRLLDELHRFATTEEVGREDLDGTPVRRLRVAVDLDELRTIRAIRDPSGFELIDDEIRELTFESFDVWVDDEGRLRKVSSSLRFSHVDGDTHRTVETFVLGDYGRRLEVTVPSPARTLDVDSAEEAQAIADGAPLPGNGRSGPHPLDVLRRGGDAVGL